MNYLAQCTNTTAETTKLFEANQLSEGSEYDSYITIATIKEGLKDNGQGIAATEKGLTDNDHSDHQKEGTSRAQITETSPVQLKTHILIPLLISLAAMKKANTVIWTATDTATICGQHIKLVRTGGHYTLSLRKGKQR